MKRTKEVLEQVLLEHCFPISYWLGLDSCTTEKQGQRAVLQGSLSHCPWMTVRLCHPTVCNKKRTAGLVMGTRISLGPGITAESLVTGQVQSQARNSHQ